MFTYLLLNLENLNNNFFSWRRVMVSVDLPLRRNYTSTSHVACTCLFITPHDKTKKLEYSYYLFLLRMTVWNWNGTYEQLLNKNTILLLNLVNQCNTIMWKLNILKLIRNRKFNKTCCIQAQFHRTLHRNCRPLYLNVS